MKRPRLDDGHAALLFFYVCGAPRDLHSFPTRRSSDLADSSLPPTECPRRSIARPAANSRSEEHTSELQSHSDLVCRLLLEKKNWHGTSDSTFAQSSSGGLKQLAALHSNA